MSTPTLAYAVDPVLAWNSQEFMLEPVLHQNEHEPPVQWPEERKVPLMFSERYRNMLSKFNPDVQGVLKRLDTSQVENAIRDEVHEEPVQEFQDATRAPVNQTKQNNLLEACCKQVLRCLAQYPTLTVADVAKIEDIPHIDANAVLELLDNNEYAQCDNIQYPLHDINVSPVKTFSITGKGREYLDENP